MGSNMKHSLFELLCSSLLVFAPVLVTVKAALSCFLLFLHHLFPLHLFLSLWEIIFLFSGVFTMNHDHRMCLCGWASTIARGDTVITLKGYEKIENWCDDCDPKLVTCSYLIVAFAKKCVVSSWFGKKNGLLKDLFRLGSFLIWLHATSFEIFWIDGCILQSYSRPDLVTYLMGREVHITSPIFIGMFSLLWRTC